MLGIVAVGVVRESRKFEAHHVYGALRGHLCDSTAFLFVVLTLRYRWLHKLELLSQLRRKTSNVIARWRHCRALTLASAGLSCCLTGQLSADTRARGLYPKVNLMKTEFLKAE